MKWLFKILFCILLLKSFELNAQRTVSDKELSKNEIEKLAEEALAEDKFERALILYKRLLINENNNSRLNFLIGFCYLNTEYGKETSLSYLENSISLKSTDDKNNAPAEAFYYLAKAYHLNNKFSKAIQILDSSINKIPEHQIEFKNAALRLKNYCQNANLISKSKINLKIESLIDINSKYSDYFPLINSNGKEIIFTSRKKPSINKSEKEIDGEYDENIYKSSFKEEVWENPVEISNKINTLSHEKACFLSEDASKMIIQRIDKQKGSLYLSEKNSSNQWSLPKKFNSNINTKYQETNGSFSPDGKFLFFTSNRKGSLGGTDIYISEKQQDGAWGDAKNLGNKINTIYDEEMPYLHKNGTLFFSSKGHNSIGDFDIFASVKDKTGNWTEPINLGMPINSVFDDFFYIPMRLGKKAYFSSKRTGGKGNSDVFEIELDTIGRNDYIAIRGKLIFNEKDSIKNLKIVIFEENDFDTIIKAENFPNSGKYQYILKAGKKYNFTYFYDDIIIHKNIIDSNPGGSILVLDQIVNLDDIIVIPKSNIQFYKNITNNKFKTNLIVSNPKSNSISFVNSIELNSFDNNQNITQNDSSIIKNKIYSIKLADSQTKQALSYFSDIEDVKEHINNKSTYIYYVGEYIYEWEAEIQLRKIIDKYPKAKVIVNDFLNNNNNN
ncbi:MAG: PD40 domain-containing protein [Bacteroidales bacterium]|nr:PD40 domain-containing protein [Bacteroidales bacterium]MBN2758500.1 PD40 domain-containing protein [Bacteroidales bacterium]